MPEGAPRQELSRSQRAINKARDLFLGEFVFEDGRMRLVAQNLAETSSQHLSIGQKFKNFNKEQFPAWFEKWIVGGAKNITNVGVAAVASPLWMLFKHGVVKLAELSAKIPGLQDLIDPASIRKAKQQVEKLAQ
ncbi:MAG: hypothetical protein G01um101466_83 [Parcubacteria group bacterium Gr01-1014_66]|nr:MAG: hypothetical protein G01um101466_83 [Parcubacteria group bacterium Gr01-1014_66]